MGNLLELKIVPGDQFIQDMGAANLLPYSSFTSDRDCGWAKLVSRPSISIQPCLVSWVKPLKGLVKLNTDTSVSSAGAASGGLLRTHEDVWFLRSIKSLGR